MNWHDVVFRRWWKVNSLYTGKKTSSSAPIRQLAPWIHSEYHPGGCLRNPRGISSSLASPTVIRTVGRCSFHLRADDRSWCCWLLPTSAMTSVLNTSLRSTSTVIRGSRSLQARGTTRPTSDLRRRAVPAAQMPRRWYSGTSRARCSRAFGWTLSKSSESISSFLSHLTSDWLAIASTNFSTKPVAPTRV